MGKKRWATWQQASRRGCRRKAGMSIARGKHLAIENAGAGVGHVNILQNQTTDPQLSRNSSIISGLHIISMGITIQCVLSLCLVYIYYIFISFVWFLLKWNKARICTVWIRQHIQCHVTLLHITGKAAINIAIRLRFGFDSTTTKNEHVHFSSRREAS